MTKLELISFEIINRCNLSCVHQWCPSSNPLRYADATTAPMCDEHIISFLDSAIAEGFKGKIAFHYYCEPTLNLDRCRTLSQAAKERGIDSVLWTNGSCKEIPENIFAEIFVTDYGYDNECETRKIDLRPDDRLKIYDTKPNGKTLPCYRPHHLEMPITYYGDVRLCCADWRGEVRIGNIARDSHKKIFENWEAAGAKALACDYEICRRCVALPMSPVLPYKDYRLWG